MRPEPSSRTYKNHTAPRSHDCPPFTNADLAAAWLTETLQNKLGGRARKQERTTRWPCTDGRRWRTAAARGTVCGGGNLAFSGPVRTVRSRRRLTQRRTPILTEIDREGLSFLARCKVNRPGSRRSLRTLSGRAILSASRRIPQRRSIAQVSKWPCGPILQSSPSRAITIRS
jgi:hypothetical protein